MNTRSRSTGRGDRSTRTSQGSGSQRPDRQRCSLDPAPEPGPDRLRPAALPFGRYAAVQSWPGCLIVGTGSKKAAPPPVTKTGIDWQKPAAHKLHSPGEAFPKPASNARRWRSFGPADGGQAWTGPKPRPSPGPLGPTPGTHSDD